MTRTVVALVGAVVIGFCGCKTAKDSVHEQKAVYAKEGYQLVWADEYNRAGRPDTANWVYEKGFVRNEEDQWYQEENAWCENGLLVIEERREAKPNPQYVEGSHDWRKNRKEISYTSASLNTRQKHAWQYGRFVMRGKIDIRSGLWPAWWTLCVAGRWPANGEIVIMEYFRKKLLANIACLGENGRPEWFSNTFSIDSLGGQAWASKFHVWRMDWDNEAISLFVDDQLLNKVALSKLVNKDGAAANPFQQPHYMLLDLALGGMNGGEIDKDIFPTHFEVDYVRVYQKK
jgi:beta-glucanase (GH16 family)